MNDPKMLEDHLKRCEEQCRSYSSYAETLKEMAHECGTDDDLICQDLFEAEHNAKYYEGEAERIKEELEELHRRSHHNH